jgi:hypothetical protein
MKRTSYMKRASQRFLEGTRFRSPVEAVEAGVRSLIDWTQLLAEERECAMQYLLERPRAKRPPSYREFTRAVACAQRVWA